MRFVRHCLRVRDPEGLIGFYRDMMGMLDFSASGRILLGYDKKGCWLELRGIADAPYAPEPNDRYWKIGVTVRDLDHAVSFLRSREWPVSEPRQFRDIGYLAHVRDPEGFSIELLQHGFEGMARPAGNGHPIGGQATFAHITLRVCNLHASQRFCEEQLGLRLMSVQPVSPRKFTLYFYAWSDEELPNTDLYAVENRPWLWSRSYTILELQHLETPDAVTRIDAVPEAGFDGIAYINRESAPPIYLLPKDLREIR